MTEQNNFAYIILIICLVFILVSILTLIINNIYLHFRNSKDDKGRKYLTENFVSDFPNIKYKSTEILFKHFVKLKQSFHISDSLSSIVIQYIKKSGYRDVLISRLKPRRKILKINSIVQLGFIPSMKIIDILENKLLSEKDNEVIIHYISSLCEQGSPGSLPKILSVYRRMPEEWQAKIICLIISYEEHLDEYIANFVGDDIEISMKKLIIAFAEHYVSPHLKNKLVDLSYDEVPELAVDACKAISKQYPEILLDDSYFKHKNQEIQKISLNAYSNEPTEENVKKLLSYIDKRKNEKELIFCLSKMITNKPYLLNLVIKEYENEIYSLPYYDHKKMVLVSVLSKKIDYLILKIKGPSKNKIKPFIKDIILQRKLSNLIGFLNTNNSVEIEDELISVIKEIIELNSEIKDEFCIYLNERVLKKLGLEKKSPAKVKRDESVEKGKVISLYVILALFILSFPLIIFIKNDFTLKYITVVEFIKIFNKYIVYYTASISLVYTVLSLLSIYGATRQLKLWRSKTTSFLFRDTMLPPISILAPAFREEATIIESSNSLLNLIYPVYELIVINDGSPDNTLKVLVDNYNLKKVDVFIEEDLDTMKIRGVYKNPNIPKLTVIDKVNGGKADSLNAGINACQYEYFCGIDADSLLESESLLKIAAQMFDSKKESIALGGNVLPINGCKVDKGNVERISIPKNIWAKLQFIEYLRAFKSGRIGWAQLDCLMIISGAFGLYKTERVVEVGGYMTMRSVLKKDTVGEDMELVVRLSRHMNEINKKFKVHYAFNAICWTEVPETINILKNQRERWQRGLIDILFFHRKLLFNPAYGRMGTIALPYFIIFEVIGPFFELAGYIMVGIAAIFKFLDPQVALLLFISSVLFGIIVSMISIFIAERDFRYFTYKQLGELILLAIVENFGFRQLFSFWRVSGYITSMKGTHDWGKMTRKGVNNKPDTANSPVKTQ